MAGVINTGSHPKLLWPGIREIWGQTYDAHEVEYTDLYEVRTSQRAYEQDVELTGFGLAPVKQQGGGISYDSESQGWVTTYAHIAYALGYIVTKEELDDNMYKEVSQRRSKANAFSCAQTVENVAAFLYNNAFASTYYATPDGQPLISTAHVNSVGGTFSNRLTTDADLSEVALENMCIQIMGATQNRGLLISVMPQSLHIAPGEFFNANRILKSTLQSNTNNNAINVLKAVNAFPGGIKLNHYFTDADAWFVRTNIPNGMTFFWRTKPQFDQDNDFDTKNAKAATYLRFGLGCTDPRGVYGTPGA
jgi:hypothetical protein